jgi:hypothetical protein
MCAAARLATRFTAESGLPPSPRCTTRQILLTTRGFLIASLPLLEFQLTRSQQTRKHFLIASFSASSARAPRLTTRNSRLAPFPFDTFERLSAVPFNTLSLSFIYPAAFRDSPIPPATVELPAYDPHD